MKYKKIILAGGNGYLGGVLAAYYKNLAEEVIILSRSYHAPNGNVVTRVWNGKTEDDWMPEIENADMLINLCGKNVNCRYTEKNKAEIFASRLQPTALLAKVVAQLAHPPKLWINLASATIYRHAEDHPQDEFTGELGTGFSVEVCKEWEAMFFKANTPRTRKVALRMSIVMGVKDGAFPRLLNLVKLGMGGKQGNGRQMVAWIHEHDAAAVTEFLLQHNEIKGVVNCTAPNPVNNYDMMQTLRKVCKMPFGLPAPAWLLKIGAVVIGTETELTLKSRWVLPKRLTDAGFQFQFRHIEHAFSNILMNKNKA
ncbi:TIGR01777 family oxidoreductase [Mucilaginibacter auburnensis]|uniref:DUF1731 domain-containing protein n=1 Tax=Mucilaginibacter auburnensis TaxID=1457233 RepID=A0A2H9VVT4_9SPHI|nr:TIGR01777 family oxidoreductase [Mucilaginibacter auburnensis]PJJ84928.1 hypothetical protein CLV57_1950 [Mucilaginibacter auburnensis]